MRVTGEPRVTEESIEPAPLARGVWHPAFLEELRKVIVLDFFVAQSTLIPIVSAFEDGNIQHVKAGFVRGIHDVMIRRYVPRALEQAGRFPLSLPFSHLSEEQRQHIFADDSSFQPFQVIIYPEDVLKYRGKPVPQGKSWNKAQADIKYVMVRSDVNLLIERSCALAADIEPSADNRELFEVPQNLIPLFQLGIDHHMPAALQSGNIKEFYVFIRAQRAVRDETASDEFRQQIVMDKLMNHRGVREICVCHSRPQMFHFSIQLEISPNELNDIVFDMHTWAHEHGIAFGTRTYEVWRYLSRDSIAGIQHTTMEDFERDFLAEAKRVAGDIRSFILTNAQRGRIALAWVSFRKKLVSMGECERYVGDFYLRLALHNFLRFPSAIDHLEECQTAWARLSIYVEDIAKELLIDTLQLNRDVKGDRRNDIATEVERRIPERIKEKEENKKNTKNSWDNIKIYPARIAANYYNDLVGSEDRLRLFKKNIDKILDKRNWVVHERRSDRFQKFIDLQNKDWADALNNIEDATQHIVEALLDIEQEMKRLQTPGCS